MAISGKAGSCLPLVGSLQYRTLANYMYWFPLPFQLPVVIWPVQCWKRRKTRNKQIQQQQQQQWRPHHGSLVEGSKLLICLAQVIYNLRCGVWKLILSSYQCFIWWPLVWQSSNSVAKTNTLHLLWLYSSTCEDKVRLFYTMKCNKFCCNLTFYKLNTYLILTRINPPYLPA